MKEILKKIYCRLVRNKYTTAAGVLLLIGWHMFTKGKISFDDYKDWVALIPTLLLLIAKDPTRNEQPKP